MRESFVTRQNKLMTTMVVFAPRVINLVFIRENCKKNEKF